MTPETSVPVNAAKTNFEVIELLRRSNGATVSEVANRLDLPTSTAHDHLKTLHDLEYLVKRDDEYRIGMRFLEFGDQERQNLDLYRVAKPEVDALAERTGDHANLMIEEHGYGVYLHKKEGEDAAQLDTHPGFRTHLHATSLGKAILSQMDERRVEEIIETRGLPDCTENTITTPDALFDELRTIRERRYAVDREERAEGVRCVAAPITHGDELLGAISVSGLASKMRGDRFEEEIPELIVRSANKIEVNVSFSR